MNGIAISVDPVMVSLGGLAVRWYGLFFALAIGAGVWVGLCEARRKGLNVEQVQWLALWSIVGGLLGARLFHVIDRWEFYAAHPLQVLSIWEGGMAVYGGLIGGLSTGAVLALRHRLPAWRLADAVAPGLILGQALGRLACIPNGDAAGSPANLPWAFIYTNPLSLIPRDLLGVPTHPYPVYELLFDLAVFGLLWQTRKHFRVEGLVFLTYVVVYAAGRFLLSFYRTERIWFWGLQEAQVIALAALLIGTLFLIWRLMSSFLRSVPISGSPSA